MKNVLAAMGISLLLTGCATAQYPMGGLFYTNLKGPNTVINENASHSKRGTACAQTILHYVAFGDASIKSAKKEGNISSVSTIDYSDFSIFIFYQKTCTIVTGV